jgi:predicted cobalt transporter CbtA
MVTRTSHPADWKVTIGHRILVKVGWGLLTIAGYLGVAAMVVGMQSMWWYAAGFALIGLLIAATLPEPVPQDLVVERRRWMDVRVRIDA